MNETGIGRVLVASLHQGIADLIPTRLEFYENWLHPAGLRNGKIGLAPLAAVLSFLRHEGESYALVTRRAGEYAAEWTAADRPAIERALIRSLPLPLRARMVLRMGRRMVRRTYRGSRASVQLRRGSGLMVLRGSIFCGVRAPLDHPLCEYYAAALMRLLALFGIDGDARVSSCRGAGDAACLVEITVRGSLQVEELGRVGRVRTDAVEQEPR